MARPVKLKKSHYSIFEASQRMGLDEYSFLKLIVTQKINPSVQINLLGENEWMSGYYEVRYSLIANALKMNLDFISLHYEHDAYTVEPAEQCDVKIPLDVTVSLPSLEITQIKLAMLLRLPAGIQNKSTKKGTSKQGVHWAKKTAEMLRIAKRLLERKSESNVYISKNGTIKRLILAKAVFAELAKSSEMREWFKVITIARKIGANEGSLLPKSSKK